MSKDYRKELADMKRLMNYGLNESEKSNYNSGILEYSQMGADGNTYGILREGTKYFIKVAPKKDTKLLAEDFDYVGGFLNRKAFESYNKASKALNMHLISLNEDGSKPVKSQFNINESAEWQTKETVESRKELNRFYELVSKVDNLLSENVHYISEDKNNPYTDKSKASYNKNNGGGHKGNIGTQQPLGITEKDFTDNDEKDAEKKQADYEKAKVNDKNGFGDHNIDEDGGNPYQEKPTKMKTEGKKRVIKLSEEQKKQVLAWRDDRAFVHDNVDTDRSHGTEIGDSDPYIDTVNEGFETSEWGSEGLPSNAGVGDAKDYKEPFDIMDGVRQPVTEDVEDEPFYGDYDNEDDEAYAKYAMEPGIDDDERDERIYDLLGSRGERPEALGFANGGFGDDMRDELYEAEDYIDNLPDDDYSGLTDDGYGEGPWTNTRYDSTPKDNKTSTDADEDEFDVELDSDDDDDMGYQDAGMYGDEDDYDMVYEGQLNEVAPLVAAAAKTVGTAVASKLASKAIDKLANKKDEKENGQEDEKVNEDYIFEVTLNDFGKHPAYRKKPMTLPANADGSEWGEDWNDETAKNELPYGRKIGSSAPFNNVVDTITDAVVTALSKKKR